MAEGSSSCPDLLAFRYVRICFLSATAEATSSCPDLLPFGRPQPPVSIHMFPFSRAGSFKKCFPSATPGPRASSHQFLSRFAALQPHQKSQFLSRFASLQATSRQFPSCKSEKKKLSPACLLAPSRQSHQQHKQCPKQHPHQHRQLQTRPFWAKTKTEVSTHISKRFLPKTN